MLVLEGGGSIGGGSIDGGARWCYRVVALLSHLYKIFFLPRSP